MSDIEPKKATRTPDQPSKSGAARAPIKFCCRVCGHNSYTEVRAPRPVRLGGPQSGPPELLHCVCNGCSTIFTDPKKFSAYIRPDLP